MRRTLLVTCAAAVALVAPAAAQAQVIIEPDRAVPGEFKRFNLRVPNDRSYTSTNRVVLEFPAELEIVLTEPVPGWTVKLKRLPNEHVSRITWNGQGKQGRIGPEEFQDFGLAMLMPRKQNKILGFRTFQSYVDGEVDTWLGAPSDRITTTGGEPVAGVVPPAETRPAAVVRARPDVDDDDAAPTWLAALALVVGVLGLLAGIGGLSAARRHASAT
jgi:uncharacterized protein YcnI